MPMPVPSPGEPAVRGECFGNRRENDGKWARRCSNCRLWQPENKDHFPTQVQRGITYWNSWCRECFRKRAREQQRQRRADPIEAQRVRDEKERHRTSSKGRAWRAQRNVIDNSSHRQRLTGTPCTLTPDQWTRVCELLDHCCTYCGCQPERLEIDHVIPISADDYPGTILGNVVPACIHCNRSKGGKQMAQWRPELMPRLLDVLARIESAMLA
jgi:5-methylcytosine-specific restriction endonuclease McrA